jgi:hypothetical protein
MDEQVTTHCCLVWHCTPLIPRHLTHCLLSTQAVESVLAECGQDIDAAIRRLTELKLSNAEQQQQAQAAMAASNQQHDTASVADGGQQQEQQQQQQHQAPSGPQTAEQWVDALVQAMAAAKDFTDARGRAAKMLQAFEQFVSARSKEVRQDLLSWCACCATETCAPEQWPGLCWYACGIVWCETSSVRSLWGS